MPDEPTCEATQYAPGPCQGPARFRVVYRSRTDRKVLDSHPACFRHGLAEVDRAHASGGIALADLEETH